MIKFQEQVPSIYPSASRDFQYLCWLFNIVLNSVKHNVDDLYDLPNSNSDPRLTELLAMTLGFKVKRNYDQNQLRALVASLPRILKHKGTKAAIEMAGNALIAASGATGSFSSEVHDGELIVVLPTTLVDVSLFTDLLPYILPAGMTCHIVRKNQVQSTYATRVDYSECLLADWVPDLARDSVMPNTIVGLANMFDVNSHEPNFANYRDYDINTLNLGLLDNNVIPMLITPVTGTPPVEADFTEEPNEHGTTMRINKYSVESTDEGDTIVVGGE